jgi:GntR family transcriptional regulator
MFDFRLEPQSRVPAYMQLVSQVRQGLRLGALLQGDRLPTVKEVVERLLLSPNTVLKAYQILEQEGLIKSRQGVGTFVVHSLADPALVHHAALRRRLVRWVRDAQKDGLDAESIEALMSSVRQEYFPLGAGDTNKHTIEEDVS